jgi:hypothetical protein
VKEIDMKTLRTKTTKSKNAKRSRTLPRVARAPKVVEKTAPVETPVAPEPAPEIFPFDRGAVNEHAPFMTLVAAMFEAPDLPARFEDRSAAFMANMLLCLADETELGQAASEEDTLDRSATIGRFVMRLDARARIAVEIARRIQAGQVPS